MEEIEKKMNNLLLEAKKFAGGKEDEIAIAGELRHKLEAILYLPIITSRFPQLQPKGVKAAAEYLNKGLTDSLSIWGTLFSWLFIHTLGEVVNSRDFVGRSRSWIDEWRLGQKAAEDLAELGMDESTTWKAVTLVKILTSHQRWFDQKAAYQVMEKLVKDSEVQQLLQVNRYNDILWFNKEAFEELIWWLMLISAIEIGFNPLRPVKELMNGFERSWSMIQSLREAEQKSEYQVEKLLETLKSDSFLTADVSKY